MNEKLTVVIVCYNRYKYTKQCIFSVLENIRTVDNVLIIDNGSNDSSRDFIKKISNVHSNVEYYFPDTNLYVNGAWKYVANNINLNDYVLLLDNDAKFTDSTTNWYRDCIKIFRHHENLASIGLYNTPNQGTYAKGIVDLNYISKRYNLNDLQYYETDKYAGFRLDNSILFKENFKNWEQKWIEEKYNQKLNTKGLMTIRLIPGIIDDLSDNNFDDPEHISYYEEFWGNHKNNLKMYNHLSSESKKSK